MAASLPLNELEQLALANNPAVARAAARVRALRGKWLQAGLPPNPTLGYRGEEMGEAGTAGMQGGFVAQEFITGGKLGLSRAVVSQEIRSAQQQLAAVERSVLTDVRLAYYDALIAQRRLALVSELVQISHQAVAASERLLEVGDIPRVGLLQTEVEANNTLILRRRAENEMDAAWRRLTSVVGLPEMQRTHLVGDLEGATRIMDFQELYARLVTESPETAEALAEVARACWALERAYAEVIPNVSTQAAVLYDNSSGDTVAGLQVSLPWPLWNRNQGAIQEASQQVVAARQNVARVELSLRERLTAAFQQYADARYQVGIYSGEILPKARETFDLVATGYEAGEVGYLDLLAAQRTYFQTTLSYIDALRDLWQATVRIDGMLLSDSLQGSDQP
jgi:cobalt-zinc-cadmium efflux system outer membrane protein